MNDYDSDYNSDSVASENQPLEINILQATCRRVQNTELFASSSRGIQSKIHLKSKCYRQIISQKYSFRSDQHPRLATSRPYFSSDEVARASASDVSRGRSTFPTAKPKLLERTFRKSTSIHGFRVLRATVTLFCPR